MDWGLEIEIWNLHWELGLLTGNWDLGFGLGIGD